MGTPAGRTGRPPLTERDKAATRLQIARGAVHLFAAKGVGGTSADDIAATAGISARTLWRYFPAKEDCVRPLLTGGVEDMARRLRDWPRGASLAEVLQIPDQPEGSEGAEGPEGAEELGPAGTEPESAADLGVLVRLTRTEPGLRAVWLSVHREAEDVFAGILAAREGVPPGDLSVRVRAGMLNLALRLAVEEWAFRGDDPARPSLGAALRTALRAVGEGLPG